MTDVREHLRSDAERDVFRLAYNSALAAGETEGEATARASAAVGQLRLLRAGGQGIVLKFDPSQPREPAGTSVGGRWAAGSAAAALDEAPEDRAEWPEHIRALGIPPAWTDVRYDPDPEAALQAVGRDAKGRAQYVYSEAHAASQAAAKFSRVRELEAKLAAVERENAAHARSDDPDVAEHADAAALVMATGIRPGSTTDTGADERAYGATTLEGRHVKSVGGRVTLEFTGKSGVALSIPVEDKVVARMVAGRAKRAGKSGRLFPRVSRSSLAAHVDSLDGGGFKTKDLRTALGTRTARAEVARMTAPTSAAGYKRAVREVAKVVAARLGNTPTVALQSYIDPTVFAGWRAHAPRPKVRKAADDPGYDAHFGRVGAPRPDWRGRPEPDEDEDEVLRPTPPDVVALLGFDPLEDE